MTTTTKISTILFDLDGTLLDSAKDLHQCLEKILIVHHRPPIGLDKIQHHLNAGAVGFLEMGFGNNISAEKLAALREEFLAYYDSLIFEGQSHFFPGTLELLSMLKEKNLQWGIVTNKRERFTTPILKNIGILDHAAVVICGDTVEKSKPSPAPLLTACKKLQISAAECCYVGDSIADMIAAKDSPMPGLLALWGYWPRLKYSIQGWPYTALLHQPEDLFRACRQLR